MKFFRTISLKDTSNWLFLSCLRNPQFTYAECQWMIIPKQLLVVKIILCKSIVFLRSEQIDQHMYNLIIKRCSQTILCLVKKFIDACEGTRHSKIWVFFYSSSYLLWYCFVVKVITSTDYTHPVDTERKLNVHRTFNLLLVSTGCLLIFMFICLWFRFCMINSLMREVAMIQKSVHWFVSPLISSASICSMW